MTQSVTGRQDAGFLPEHQDVVPVLKPLLPDEAALRPLLREIDASRRYANHGPLLQRLEDRLCRHFGRPAGTVAAFANGTAALTAALGAALGGAALGVALGEGERTGRLCLMPSWTFVATPAAAMAAGLVPHFIDVAPDSWAPDPARLRARTDLGGVAAIVLVLPFGAPLDLAAWERLSADTGIPVVVDAAAGFDALGRCGLSSSRLQMVVSLHATKALGIGEGGLLLDGDGVRMERARRLGNFGFLGSPCAELPGLNAKMAEHAAAVGLAALDGWPARRGRLAALAHGYRADLAAIAGVEPAPGFGGDAVSSCCCVLTPLPAVRLAAALEHRGVETRRWWQSGCHAHPAFAGCPRDPLPVTEDLAARCLGLPFFPDLTDGQRRRVADALRLCLDEAGAGAGTGIGTARAEA
nr:DegT/DnrJ/EryC1/StrS family aminotransferase [Azospirillum sp. 412522]